MIKLLAILIFSFSDGVNHRDSLGVETVNGKMFVIHKVDEKETLYSISKRYGTTVDAIKQFNSAAASGLEIGQILKVPYLPKQPRSNDGMIHKVAAKETLFSISKLYGVSMDDLKQWNNLGDNSLSIGQELIVKKKNTNASSNTANYQPANKTESKDGTHVVAQKETMYSIARQYGITVDQLKQWNNIEGNDLKIGQALIVKQPNHAEVKNENPATASQHRTTEVAENRAKTELHKDPVSKQETITKQESVSVKQEPAVQETIKISESVRNGDEIIESGVAELIEGTEGNRKYLALHRTAPVGTILKVRNEMNNREVFVRVMGKLPETALTDKVVIRISKSAYDRLGAIDARFRVEVTYYK
jgi:LysM repeat protein